MNLQYLLYYLSFLAIYFPFSRSNQNKGLVTMKTGLGEISPCSMGLQLYAMVNNTADEDYFVELISDECCIDSDEDIDCDSIDIIGESSEVIQKGNSKTFILIAPVLDPYERKGNCVIHVDSRPVDRRSEVMRDTITIPFDTTLKNNADTNPDLIKKCNNVDEDPLNDCKPVNCDVYYNGKKPIYDENTKRCIEVPKCRSKKSEASDLYDSIANKRVVVDPIENVDTEFIKSLNKDRKAKEIVIVEAPENIIETCLADAATKTKEELEEKLKTNVEQKLKIFDTITKYLITNRYTLVALGLVLLLQCCLICTTVIYCMTKQPGKCGKNKVDRNYFNYRQDVSVTTPLIATSNMDTETAFDYISESNNIEKKIKCYRSCQKVKKSYPKNDPKVSMSDDILTKCLNRRDWNTRPRSDNTKEANSTYTCNQEFKTLHSNVRQTPILESPIHKKEKTIETPKKREINKFKQDYSDSDSSEKMIQCHDYNVARSMEIRSDNRKTPSMSTEKGAQACFSNDSIDDYLSERGMTYLAGDQLPKYSFTSSSDRTDQSCSSKTSKNRNVLKNVLSFLSNKSRKYTASEPGGKKEKKASLELIHMSRASMYSSSASDYRNIEGVKTVKLDKDYRSTF